MASAVSTIERRERSAVVRVRGDLALETARETYGAMRGLARRRDVRHVVLDLGEAGRLDSSGIAIVALLRRQLARSGKTFELAELTEQHRRALELLPEDATGGRLSAAIEARSGSTTTEDAAPPGPLERIGDAVIGVGLGAGALFSLVGETLRQGAQVIARRRKLPAGALGHQIAQMGVDGVFIVGLLSFLLGMTMAFQGAVQLQKFGAGVFVADAIGLSMVREISPLMTAVVITGRTGASIAAELGTMRVRSEIDALTTMGINPVRFLVLPRIASITVVGPALSLIGMFIGIAGGMVVAAFALDLPPMTFWNRTVDRVTAFDFTHGLVKSVMFAWIIGFTGSHLGLRAGADAGSVGAATTRTVVTSIFFIILVDAVFATVTTLVRHR